MIYFSADLHFFHTNIIKLANRPFLDAKDMGQKIVENFNSVLSNGDELFLLGDCAYKNQNPPVDLISSIKGKKYLIIGNHDRRDIKKQQFLDLFEWAKYYHEFNYNRRMYVLSHYPFLSWNGKNRGSIHLHGHTHDKVKSDGQRRLDVGVDSCNYFPISIDQILERLGIE